MYIYLMNISVQYILHTLKMKYVEQISGNEFEKAYNIQQFAPSPSKIITMPFPFLFIKNQNRKTIHNLHKFPSGCITCKASVQLFGSKEAEDILDEGKKTEIKYDVSRFSVMQCKNNHIHAYRLKAKHFDFFRYCKSCNNKTSKSSETKMIEVPTYEKSGKREIKYKCLYCNDEYSEIHIMPQLTKSSSSSSYSYKGSSSSSSSRSYSGGSSSSSSSRSWGGGRTGGGGAGGKW